MRNAECGMRNGDAAVQPVTDSAPSLRPAGNRSPSQVSSAQPGCHSVFRTGVLGGTFDPPHLGHLILAEEARCALALDRVLLVPAAQPWRKSDRAVSPAAARLAMLRLAVAGDPYFDVSTLEIDRGGPTYTVETLAALRAELAPVDELYFILGEDALLDLPRWRDPAGIIRLARVAVAARDGDLSADLAALEQQIPGIRARVDVVPMPQIGISSTEIRRRVREGGSIRFLVPPAVAGYIAEQGLYRAGGY
jgi:nicotinate-nucleotide adenylyltransferase